MSIELENTCYDLIVIGSGAGTKLVRPVSALGKKVAIVDKGPLGGTCLNFGCIPSKMLIHPADLISNLQEAHKFFIELPTAKVDSQKLLQDVFSCIERESKSIEPLYQQDPNIDLFQGHASFISPHHIEVEGRVLTAPKIIIAAGAEPSIPKDITGIQDTPFWTYKDFMRTKSLPKSVVVIGGGFIAVELGYFLSQMGVDVTFVVRNSLLSQQDRQVQKEFEEQFCRRQNVYLHTKVQAVSYQDDRGFMLDLAGPNGEYKKIETQALLLATGIEPCTKNMGLEKAGIELDKRGFIQVDQYLQTTCKGVYALGDCIGRYFFRHSANYEGQWLFDHLFVTQKNEGISYPYMPHAVFSHPQLATVGASEEELIQKGIEFFVGFNAYKDSAMGMALKSEYGFVKLLFAKKSGKLLGAHIIGPEASNMIHIAIAMMHMGATCQDMVDMIYVHPALPEIMRNAARKAWATCSALSENS